MSLTALVTALEDACDANASTALRTGRRRGLAPLRALLAAGIPLTALQTAAWRLRGYDSVEFDPRTVAVEDMARLPLDVSRRIRGVAVGDDTVAVADPSDISAMDELRRALPRAQIVVAESESIDEALRRYEARHIMGSSAVAGPADTPKPISLTDAGPAESPAARTVAAIVTYAAKSHASDIHISCTDAGAEVRIRIDGVLHTYTTIPGVSAAASMIGRIKVLGGLDLGQRRLPQDGRIQASVDGRVIDIRLATLPNVWDAEDAVLRLLDSSVGVATLDSLGLGDAALKAWARLWQQPHGLVLVAGPTGCGKSTTLYATLRRIATPDLAVRTVEDPVEVRIPGVTQVQVNPRAGLTFASTLRSFLRADPDVILVGEIRDHETARVATEAAVTGHLVLATVHTSAASQVPVRLVEMGVPGYLVSAALRGAMAQRLVRRVCGSCRARRPVVGWPDDAGPAPSHVAEPCPTGCARCAHTGYRGRLAAAEVMVVDEPMRGLIAGGTSLENVTAAALDAGMVTLRHAIADLVREGETSLNELTRVTASGE